MISHKRRRIANCQLRIAHCQFAMSNVQLAMNNLPSFRTFLALGVCLSLTVLSGCERGLGGGGSIVPTVAVKLDAVADAGGSDAPVEVAGYGSVTGRVILDGAVPALGSFLPAGELKDPSVCVREQIPDERIIVGPDGGLANVFIFLPRKPAGTPEEAAAAPSEAVIFDQKVCVFLPHAMLLRAGQVMRVLNSDPIVHNTHTNPKSNSQFNSTVKPGEQEGIPVVYQRPEREPVRVVCDFHPWMLAWHLPLDHPYGALTGEEGTFTIEGVPAGNHKFAVWHEGRKLGDYSVTVQPDQQAQLDITISGADLALIPLADGVKTVVLAPSR